MDYITWPCFRFRYDFDFIFPYSVFISSITLSLTSAHGWHFLKSKLTRFEENKCFLNRTIPADLFLALITSEFFSFFHHLAANLATPLPYVERRTLQTCLDNLGCHVKLKNGWHRSRGRAGQIESRMVIETLGRPSHKDSRWGCISQGAILFEDDRRVIILGIGLCDWNKSLSLPSFVIFFDRLEFHFLVMQSGG